MSRRLRTAPQGLCDRVLFFHHQNPEDIFGGISDRRDENSKGSKSNVFEAEVVLKSVKYLGQQGYGTDKLVVLSPHFESAESIATVSKQTE
ncbi:hypothetical protein N7519_004521 [Penicillium mononematosum]|uniref:uncharacterized protein n=1 Tax=Penicillium mononematosum TaxID=268346 RepID=UPI0025467852|nr:uncharacterized protein N7519_004521 [Penicillium mononematosum]KAJ6189613.1 hypothetical protein N7519_004521 [Penicillium mononematosum]